jgi:hypothetical protein
MRPWGPRPLLRRRPRPLPTHPHLRIPSSKVLNANDRAAGSKRGTTAPRWAARSSAGQ